jgi:hypothetical protein
MSREHAVVTTKSGRTLLDLLHELQPGSAYSVWITAIEAEARAAALAEVRRAVEGLPTFTGGLKEYWPTVSRAAVFSLLERLAAK